MKKLYSTYSEDDDYDLDSLNICMEDYELKVEPFTIHVEWSKMTVTPEEEARWEREEKERKERIEKENREYEEFKKTAHVLFLDFDAGNGHTESWNKGFEVPVTHHIQDIILVSPKTVEKLEKDTERYKDRICDYYLRHCKALQEERWCDCIGHSLTKVNSITDTTTGKKY